MKLTGAIVAGAVAGAAATTYPQLAKDWTALTTSSIVVNQGGTINSDGSVCCPASSPECKVQTAYQAAKQYYDVTNQRMKIAAPDNSGVVYDFKAKKAYQVNAQNVCTGYCPIPANQDGLAPLGIAVNSTLLSAPTTPSYCDGQSPCQDWQFKDKLFNVITMETDDMYITTVNGQNVPITLFQDLTPFGEPIGNQKQTWAQFTAGTPAASVFQVGNATTCPEAQCSSGDGDSDSSSHKKHGDDPFPPTSSSSRKSVGSVEAPTFRPRFFGQVDGIEFDMSAFDMKPSGKIEEMLSKLSFEEAAELAEFAAALPEGHAYRQLLDL